MKVRITFELGDDERRALAIHYGEADKADRRRIIAWIRSTVEATLQDIMHDAEQEADDA